MIQKQMQNNVNKIRQFREKLEEKEKQGATTLSNSIIASKRGSAIDSTEGFINSNRQGAQSMLELNKDSHVGDEMLTDT